MKIGDLIRDKEFPNDFGIIIEFNYRSYTNYCRVLAMNGRAQWLPKDYILDECEVINENR